MVNGIEDQHKWNRQEKVYKIGEDRDGRKNLRWKHDFCH